MTFRERFEKVIERRAEESVKPYIMSLRSIDRTSLPEAYIFGYHEAAQDLLPLIEECYEAFNSISKTPSLPSTELTDTDAERADQYWSNICTNAHVAKKMINKLNAFLGEGES